jgi:hypothetical protein
MKTHCCACDPKSCNNYYEFRAMFAAILEVHEVMDNEPIVIHKLCNLHKLIELAH